MSVFSFLDVTASAATYTLSLHDALPISVDLAGNQETTKSALVMVNSFKGFACATQPFALAALPSSATVTVSGDRKSTRLNSSHITISYAVFCLKKKTAEGGDLHARHLRV